MYGAKPLSVVDDVRKVLQDLIAPELREILALRAEQKGDAGELKGEILALRAEQKGDAGELRADIKRLEQKMDSQYAALLNALTIDKRLTMLEQAHARADNPKLA